MLTPDGDENLIKVRNQTVTDNIGDENNMEKPNTEKPISVIYSLKDVVSRIPEVHEPSIKVLVYSSVMNTESMNERMKFPSISSMT